MPSICAHVNASAAWGSDAPKGVPSYRIAATRGQAHAQTFEVECEVPALQWRATGVGALMCRA